MTKSELASKVKTFREKVEDVAQTIPDEKIEQCVSLFPRWSGDGVSYAADFRVQYDDVVYKCLQAHTSQSSWTPTASPSLWAKVLTADGEIKEWEQPDSTNPYMTGDKVTFNGKTYESTVDNNVWSPATYGWREV